MKLANISNWCHSLSERTVAKLFKNKAKRTSSVASMSNVAGASDLIAEESQATAPIEIRGCKIASGVSPASALSAIVSSFNPGFITTMIRSAEDSPSDPSDSTAHLSYAKLRPSTGACNTRQVASACNAAHS